MSNEPSPLVSCWIRVGRSCASNERDHVVAAVEVAVLALLGLRAARVGDDQIRLAVAVEVALRARAHAARVLGGEIEVAVEVLVGLLAHDLPALVDLHEVDLAVGVRVELLAERLLLGVELTNTSGFPSPFVSRSWRCWTPSGERDRGVERPARLRIALLRRRDATFEQGDDVDAAVAVGVLLLAGLLARAVARRQIERAVAVRVGFLALDASLGVEPPAQIDLAVAVRVLFEALRAAVREEDRAIGHAIAVAILLGLQRFPFGVAGAPEVGFAVARRVAAQRALVARGRVELDPRVDGPVLVRVLLLTHEPIARVVEVPEIGAAVSVFIDLDARELPVLEELAPCGRGGLRRRDRAANQLTRRALDLDLEVAVVILVELFERDVFVGVERVARVDFAVPVAVLFLGRLAAVAEDQRGVLLPIAIRVRLAAQQRVAVERRDHLGNVVAGLVLFLAHAFAVLVEAVQLGVTILVGVDRLARLAAVGVEDHDELHDAIRVGVDLLAVFLAVLEQRHAVEFAVVIGVGLAAHDRLAVLREARDHVRLAVAVRVLFYPGTAIALEEERHVELAVVVRVLLL